MPQQANKSALGFTNFVDLNPPAKEAVTIGHAPVLGSAELGQNIGRLEQGIEVDRAAGRQFNDVANFIDLTTRKHFQPDPEFDLTGTLKASPYWDNHADSFIGVGSQAEFDSVAGRIDRELKDKETLERAGWAGTVAGVSAGLLSPTMFLPLVGEARGARAVFQGIGYGALAGAAQELPLLAAQETRDPIDSVGGIAAAAVLGGVLGGAVGFLGRAGRARIEAEMEGRPLAFEPDNVAGDMALPHGAAAIPEPRTTLSPLNLETDVGDFTRVVPAGEAGYVYHSTSIDRAVSIAEDGKLEIHEPSYGTADQFSWPDGTDQPRSYWSKDPGGAIPFTPEGKPILLRSQRDERFTNERGTPDVFTESEIPAAQLEYLDKDGAWRPLTKSADEPPRPSPIHEMGGGSTPEAQSVGAAATNPRLPVKLKGETPYQIKIGGKTFEPFGAAVSTINSLPFEKSPVLDTILQKFSSHGRWMMSQLSDGGMQLEGAAIGGTAEKRIKTWYGGLYEGYEAIDHAYQRYVFEGVKPKAFGNIKALARSIGSGKLSKSEFKKEIAHALMSGDKSDVPFIEDAVGVIRQKVYTPLFEEAKKIGLIPENAEIKDPTYFNRLYNKRRIQADKPGFISVIGTHFADDLNARFLSGLERLQNAEAKDQQTIADLLRSPEEIQSLREQFKADLEELNTSLPGDMQDLEEQIAELEAKAREAKNDPNAGKTSVEVIDGKQVLRTAPSARDLRRQAKALVEKGGEPLAEVRGKRAEINRRMRNLNRSFVSLVEKHQKKLARLERIEDLSIGSIERAIRSSGRFVADLGKLSDEELGGQLDKLKGLFSQAAEGYDRGIERITKLGQEDWADDETLKKLAGYEDFIQGRADRLNELAGKIDESDAVFDSREALRSLVEEGRQEMLRKVVDLNARRARRAERLAEEAAKIAPERYDEILANLRAKHPQRVLEFTERMRQLGADTVDVSQGAADFSGEAQKLATQVTDIILGTDHRIAGMDILQGPRGPQLARMLDIPSTKIADFLELDVEKAMASYMRTMASDVEVTRKLGSPNGMAEFYRLTEEMNAKLEKLKASTPPEEFAKKSLALQDKYTAMRKNLDATVSRLRHTYGIPDDPDSMGYRLGRAALNLNVLRFMGGVTISSLADVGRPVMKYGLGRTFRDGFLPMITNFKALQLSGRELRLAGTALDTALHSRAHSIFDLADDFGRHSKVERGLEWATGKQGLIAAFDYWTSGMKQFSGMIAHAKTLDDIRILVEGGSKKEVADATEFLSAQGIDGDLAQRIWAEVNTPTGGNNINGVLLPNTESWADEGARQAYRTAILGQVDDTIITPGVERPLWVDKSMPHRLVAQFRSFALSSSMKTVVAGLQQRDMAVVNGMAISLAMGGLSYYLWAMSVGGKARSEMENAGFAKWADEAITRSGLLGGLGEYQRVLENIPGLEKFVTLSGRRTTRYDGSGIIEAIGGPSLDLASKAAGVVSGISDPTKSTVHQLRLMLPLQNVSYLRQLFDAMEEATGVPEKRQ